MQMSIKRLLCGRAYTVAVDVSRRLATKEGTGKKTAVLPSQQWVHYVTGVLCIMRGEISRYAARYVHEIRRIRLCCLRRKKMSDRRICGCKENESCKDDDESDSVKERI